MTNLLNRIFGAPEEINGGGRCPTYLYRWTLAKFSKGRGIYLHHFVGDDWSSDLHDHPKRFISIGLWGWYIEETPYQPADSEWARLGPVRTTYHAPWIRSFPATHIHRLVVPSKNCWTLVIVLKSVREWGFWHLGRFIPWRSYVKGEDSAIADKMKVC
jgi:hypothetical protein